MLLERTRVRTHDVRVSASGVGLRSDAHRPPDARQEPIAGQGRRPPSRPFRRGVPRPSAGPSDEPDEAGQEARPCERHDTATFEEPCPTSEELVNYVLGILEVEPATEVEAHLLRCPDCRIEVEALRGALESLLAPTP